MNNDAVVLKITPQELEELPKDDKGRVIISNEILLKALTRTLYRENAAIENKYEIVYAELDENGEPRLCRLDKRKKDKIIPSDHNVVVYTGDIPEGLYNLDFILRSVKE